MNTPPSDVPSTSTSTYISLSGIVKQYSQQPDILELILLSKVQEDRRRTEELKLRSKELDWMFRHASSPPPACPCCRSAPTPPLTAGTTDDHPKDLQHPQRIQPAMIPPLFQEQCGQKRQQQRRRRRQRMQTVTNVIETHEFPYHDDYLWKNNGNTVHKTSGTKSIYYKCANHPKGCPVNKTVTFQDDGGYLIKYRGHHLDNCHRIKRVVDV